jgi:hypothetical protein
LRVDVVASFNVRVGRKPEDVGGGADSARRRCSLTLRHSSRTISSTRCAPSPEMTMEDLHLRRHDIGSRVAEIVGLAWPRRHGIAEPAITKLDQPSEFFNRRMLDAPVSPI